MRYIIFATMLMAETLFALPKDLGLTRLHGEPAVFNDKPNKLVIFWASWCSDCKEKLATTLPELDKRPDVEVIAINTDTDVERAKDFVEKNKVSIAVYRHPTKDLQKLWQIYSVPHWVVLRKNGMAKGMDDQWIVIDHSAGFEEKRVEKALNTKLKENTP